VAALAIEHLLKYMYSAKPKASWVLKYVKQAVGETDCPDSIPEFISQRRRSVLNSATFFN
jgi:chitin synthase